MEARLAREAGLQYAGISAGKYRRIPHHSLLRRLSDIPTTALNARDIAKLAAGVTQSLNLVRRFRPDVVFVKGGFVGLPVGIAAKILKIPLVIHESDLTPGLTNRILSRWAVKIGVGFPAEFYRGLPSAKLIFTGNPVRPEILDGDRRQAKKMFFGDKKTGPENLDPVLLVVGGSQGARPINQAVLSDLPDLLEIARVIHVTGPEEHEAIRRQTAMTGVSTERYSSYSFLSATDMAHAYAASDVVISRAGANTIAELATLKKAVILIPNRLMAAHQLVNARRLQKLEAVKLLPEEKIVTEGLLLTVKKLLASKQTREKLGSKLATVSVPDSTERLADVICGAGSER